MWIKLGNEHLNLNHVVRVRFNRGWKNGQEDLVAEIEGLIKGEVQVFARYRGAEAAILQALFENQSQEYAGQLAVNPATTGLPSLSNVGAQNQSATPTMHDM